MRVIRPVQKIAFIQAAHEHLAFADVLVAEGRCEILPLGVRRISRRLGRIERDVTKAAGDPGQVRRLNARIMADKLCGIPLGGVKLRIRKNADAHDAARVGIFAVVQPEPVGVRLGSLFAARIVYYAELFEPLFPWAISDEFENLNVYRKLD